MWRTSVLGSQRICAESIPVSGDLQLDGYDYNDDHRKITLDRSFTALVRALGSVSGRVESVGQIFFTDNEAIRS